MDMAVQMAEQRSPIDGDEERLLARCRAGEPAALRAFYDRHVRVVLASARRLGLAAHEAEDVAQEVFTATFKELDRVEPGAVAGWLFRLTSNRAHDRFRRRRIREAFHGWLGVFEPPAPPDPPDRIALRREAEEQVGRILAKMSQKKRDVFVLFELQGFSGEEIAGQLEIPVDTVWTRLHHARLEFAKVGRSLELFDELRTTGAAS